MTGARWFGPFTPWAGNPVLRPDGEPWRSGSVYNPAAVVHDGRVVLLFRAHAPGGPSRIGLAASEDGLHFDAEPWPVLEPTEPYESRGCEDPRVTEVDGTYHLTYTGYDGTSALVCLATSTDLRTWAKHGPILPDLDTWQTLDWAQARRGWRPWNKAAGILPVPVGGRWHLYVGEGAIYHATSTDLRRWTVAGEGPVVEGRPGTWDADLVEVGAPPLVHGDRIVLLVNGARITDLHDPVLGRPVVDYRCGQVAFSLEDPAVVVGRQEEPWLQPAAPEERDGLVPDVTFVEGLVRFGDRWLAYYGQADTTTAVAIAPAGGAPAP